MSPAVPDALLLGIWIAENRAAAVGSIRDECRNTVPDALQLAGEPWTILVQCLECAALLEVRHVLILSNAPALVDSLSPPFAAQSAHHWQALRLLGGRWGGRFRAIQVNDLPKARELWQQSN